MPSFGFCGPSYTLDSVNADNQQAMNLFLERDETGEGSSPLDMLYTPGLEEFASRGARTRGQKSVNGREFVVFDGDLCEVSSVGAVTVMGAVGDDGVPCTFAATDEWLAVCSAGLIYALRLDTNVFTAVPSGTIAGVLMIEVIDSFFVAAIAGTNKFNLSALNDPTSWDPLDFEVIEVFPGNISGLKVDHRELWVFGAMGQSTVYYNNGNSDFPLAPNPSAAVIEKGLIAPLATVKIDNTIMWIGGDPERGEGVGYRANGYTPVRVTTHAVENAWQSYATRSDAVAYSYQADGHEFWVIRFPTANKTWSYDASTGQWHERGYWNQGRSDFEAHHSWSHQYVFGMHLVGDWNSGKLYNMSKDLYTDDGDLIRRVRRSPNVNAELKWIYVSELQLFLDTGIGPQPPLTDGAGNPREPQVTLRWSKDSGKTWSNGMDRGIGFAGNYGQRVRWTRIPRGRKMVFEVSMSDPVPYRFVDAYAEAEEGAF